MQVATRSSGMNKDLVELSLCLSIAAAACTGSLAEQNHPCPCSSQWTCCEAANVCVPAGGSCAAFDSGATLDAVSGPSSVDGGIMVNDALSDAPPKFQGIITLDASVGGFCSVTDAATETGADAGPVDMDPEAGPAVDAAAPCNCTRRPGAGNTLDCPAGVGEYNESTIGPGGGTIQLQGLQFAASGVAAELDFAPTAISTPTDIKLIETNIPPPQDLLDWSPVYLVEPAGLALSVRTPIRLPWSSGPVPSSQSGPTAVTTPGLSIWYSPDGSCFTRVADSYTNAGFEQGSVTQLGYFVVGTPRTAATASCP
jgi:hypothetical protein